MQNLPDCSGWPEQQRLLPITLLAYTPQHAPKIEVRFSDEELCFRFYDARLTL